MELHIDTLLEAMITAGASDLHIKVGRNPMFRVDGKIALQEGFPVITPELMETVLGGMMNDEIREIYAERLEHDFAYALPDNKSRFRVNVFHQRGTKAAVLRVIPTKIKSFDDLNLPPVLRDFCERPRGMILVTGPTGSGKSTTLAAMIDYINEKRSEHIITIEDPVEFVHPSKKSIVNQRQVGSDTDSFQNALKSALRQDPDVVLIGEMRDLETISTAITTAETGHLVLGTLHTTGACQTIDRIIDVFPPEQQTQIRMQISANIQGIVSQTLLPKSGGKGRVAAFEILVPTGAIRNMIRDGKTHQLPSIIQTSKNLGMITLEQSLAELVKKHVVSKDEAYAKAMDLEVLEELVTGKKPKSHTGG